MMIKQKKTSKFKNKFDKAVAITAIVIATFSAYFINPKPIFAQQEQKQEKTVVIDSKRDYNYGVIGLISNKYDNLTKEEKQIILEERGKIAFEKAEKLYNEREWKRAMSRYSFLAYFPKYKEYAIERAYECMDNADYYSIGILKKILIIVNKYTPDEQKQKIKSSELYKNIVYKYIGKRGVLLIESGSYQTLDLERQYPPIHELDPNQEKRWEDIN